jgi:hypothetical protein
MNLAFIITAYKYPEQLIRLVSRLYEPNRHFFVHVDKKTSPEIFETMIQGLNRFSNVHFLNRHVYHWGSFGIVQTTIDAINKLAERQLEYDYVVYMTGQCYPIKPNLFMDDFLDKHKRTSFIEYSPFPSVKLGGQAWRYGGYDRIEHWHFHSLGTNLKARLRSIQNLRYDHPYWMIRLLANVVFPKRTFPHSLHPYGGEGTWCLHRTHIDYIRRFMCERPDFAKFFKFVNIPDEIFFQTILANSSFTNDLINQKLHFIKWPTKPSSHPLILRLEDFDNLATSPALFARKFDATVDEQILDHIDKHILHAAPQPVL